MIRFRCAALIVLAALSQGCQPPPDVENVPAARLEPNARAPAAIAPTVRLSVWGLTQPPPGGVEGGAAAWHEGVLSRLGNCLIVTGGNRPIHPVFPARKVRWNEAEQSLTLAGKDYRLGDRIGLGGGGAAPAFDRRSADVDIAPCAVGDLWVVIA